MTCTVTLPSTSTVSSFAVIVAQPAPTALTMPSVTVATPPSDEK